MLNEIKNAKMSLETWNKGTVELDWLYDLVKIDKRL